MDTLKNPPVAVAIFQMLYDAEDIELSTFNTFETEFKHSLPSRRNNIEVGFDLGKTSIPLGESQISAKSKASINTVIYQSVDQKMKLELTKGKITFIDEHQYIGWDNFKKSAFKYLNIMSEVLSRVTITRLSVRFINKFNLDNFDNPQDYFNVLISSKKDEGLSFPLRQYGFRLIMDIPDSDTYSIVNQNVENVGDKAFVYTFDIDVLDRQTLSFDLQTIDSNIEALRHIKNKIFFDGITQKTQELCN